jgi:hypothetical protein
LASSQTNASAHLIKNAIQTTALTTLVPLTVLPMKPTGLTQICVTAQWMRSAAQILVRQTVSACHPALWILTTALMLTGVNAPIMMSVFRVTASVGRVPSSSLGGAT